MTVLMLGAAGNIGPHVAAALVTRHISVRALVRDDARARAVLPSDVGLVVGEFADADLVDTELDGADALFLLTPHGPEMASIQTTLVKRAAARGIKIVKISGTSSAIRPDGPDACRQHWQVEQELRSSGTPFVILRPNGFMQTLLRAIATGVRANGTVINPLAGAGISLVDCLDIGESAAAVLASTDHDGETLVLTGPAAPTYAEMADTITTLTGNTVEVIDVAPEQAGAGVLARGGTHWEADHLVEMLTLFRGGASEYVTEDVARLTGHPARSVEDYVRRHLPEFLPA